MPINTSIKSRFVTLSYPLFLFPSPKPRKRTVSHFLFPLPAISFHRGRWDPQLLRDWKLDFEQNVYRALPSLNLRWIKGREKTVSDICSAFPTLFKWRNLSAFRFKIVILSLSFNFHPSPSLKDFSLLDFGWLSFMVQVSLASRTGWILAGGAFPWAIV